MGHIKDKTILLMLYARIKRSLSTLPVRIYPADLTPEFIQNDRNVPSQVDYLTIDKCFSRDKNGRTHESRPLVLTGHVNHILIYLRPAAIVAHRKGVGPLRQYANRRRSDVNTSSTGPLDIASNE